MLLNSVDELESGWLFSHCHFMAILSLPGQMEHADLESSHVTIQQHHCMHVLMAAALDLILIQQ